MLNKILVPIDFSACADNAVNFAVQSAKILPVEIVLMHAMDIRGSVYNDYLGVNKEYNQEILHDMKTKVAKLKRKIEENEGVLVSTHISTGRLKRIGQLSGRGSAYRPGGDGHLRSKWSNR